MEQVSPSKVQSVVKAGFERMKRIRQIRAMFIAEAVGQYYRESFGMTGREPLNLIFSALRTIIPNIVSRNGFTKVSTNIVSYQDYADLLSLALDDLHEKINMKRVLRGGCVSAWFGLGVFKTGITTTGQQLETEQGIVDPGQLYTSLVDLDNFVIDPTCTDLAASAFYGHNTRASRQILLDTDGWDHDLVRKLPSATLIRQEKTVAEIGRKNDAMPEELQDMVNVVELWVPEAQAIVTVPNPYEMVANKYLTMQDYYGPESGPYTFLSLTPPIDGQVFPVAPVSLIYDFHRAANLTCSKMLDQAARQKDVLLYNPAQADTVQDIENAPDGATIPCTDPTQVQAVSIGGQNRDNETMLMQLQSLYNVMAGNPDQMAGLRTTGKTATAANILEGNSEVSIEDANDSVHDAASDISKKQAWFLHHDPLINIPLSRRDLSGSVTQIVLTPEQRRGDFLDYSFKVLPKSLTKLNPKVRANNIREFVTNVIPQAVMAAQSMMAIGQQFNLPLYLTQIAEEMQIGDWVQQLFVDPMWQQRVMLRQMMGPQVTPKASMDTTQNGGFPVQRTVMDAGQQMNQNAQMGAQQMGPENV